MISIKTPEELEIMAIAGRITAGCLLKIEKALRPGLKTRELDRIAYDYILSNHAKPAFKGYNGYPASICISINEQVVHGIPGDREILDSDLVSVDVGVLKDNYFGDAARTFLMPEGDSEKKKLLDVTKKTLEKGVDAARAGNHLSDISFAIQDFAESYGYSVVRDLVGHGIGRKMHEEPQIPNYGKPGHGPILKPGMTFAIEPMVNIGTWQVVTLEDEWTIVTKDLKSSAHFENTIVVTDNESRILTTVN
ncbi:MAG: type I methionyl aminopeptidase [candidate division Zixibacteria bacterium]|nr:type I methionyl aminopeptidase [candidate division Zixibacteria bacterium]